MFSKQRIKLFLIGLWGPAWGLAGALAAITALLFYRLYSLVPFWSQNEIAFLATTRHFKGIAHNPLQAPYKLAAYGFYRFHQNAPVLIRSVSILFALLAVVMFFYVVLRWHDMVVALLGTALFATSAWFLHYARQATPDILLTLLLTALAYGTWLRRTKRSGLATLLAAFLSVSLMYISGLVWFVVAGSLWQRKVLAEHIKKAKLSFLGVLLLSLMLLAPLFIALWKQPSLIKPLLGFPAKLPSFYDYFRHTLNVPYQIFVRGPADPTIWLGRLPLLDVFTAVMAFLGALAYYRRHLKLDRSRLLTGWLVLGTLLAGLHGSVSIVILLPAIYVLAAAGVAYLLEQWNKVYPRNPLARSLAYGLLVIAVLLACFYNLRNYYIAWPNAPATKQAFQLRH